MVNFCRDFDRNLFHIALFTENDPPRLIVKWQIDHIRQYGSNNMAFKFQSGRSDECHFPLSPSVTSDLSSLLSEHTASLPLEWTGSL